MMSIELHRANCVGDSRWDVLVDPTLTIRQRDESFQVCIDKRLLVQSMLLILSLLLTHLAVPFLGAILLRLLTLLMSLSVHVRKGVSSYQTLDKDHRLDGAVPSHSQDVIKRPEILLCDCSG